MSERKSICGDCVRREECSEYIVAAYSCTGHMTKEQQLQKSKQEVDYCSHIICGL